MNPESPLEGCQSEPAHWESPGNVKVLLSRNSLRFHIQTYYRLQHTHFISISSTPALAVRWSSHSRVGHVHSQRSRNQATTHRQHSPKTNLHQDFGRGWIAAAARATCSNKHPQLKLGGSWATCSLHQAKASCDETYVCVSGKAELLACCWKDCGHVFEWAKISDGGTARTRASNGGSDIGKDHQSCWLYPPLTL